MTPTPTPAGHGPGAPANARGAVLLACDVCFHEFGVPVAAYRSLSGIVACPRCGSLDLVLIDPGDDVPGRDPARKAG